jgi:thiosulfate/3-mercaptopyruvate sulfurtransferase
MQAHIPGAAWLDTNRLELPPLWNKVDDPALLRLLLDCGIRHDTTVIVYGRNNLAAARAAQLMLYAGVQDVRLLDGGYALWQAGGHALASGPGRGFSAAADFGAPFPGRPDYLIGTVQARALLSRPDADLVSIRTWNEYMGRTSGYSYIDARGEIPGACWGHAGSGEDINSMSEFHLADGSMKPAAAICRMWDELMDWPRISVYDGGWGNWSSDPGNPVVCRTAMTAPDSPSLRVAKKT